MATKSKIPWEIIIPAVLVFSGIYAILVWKFGWGEGSIVYGVFLVIFLISSGAGAHLLNFLKGK